MHLTSKAKTLLLFISFSLHGMDNFNNEIREQNVRRSKCVLLCAAVYAGISILT